MFLFRFVAISRLLAARVKKIQYNTHYEDNDTRRIKKVTTPVTFGFNPPKERLLSGSRYFRMVKKRLYRNSLEISDKPDARHVKLKVPCMFPTARINKADCMNEKRWQISMAEHLCDHPEPFYVK